MSSSSSWDPWGELGGVATGGVDFNVTSLGGEVCRDHVGLAHRAAETALAMAMSALCYRLREHILT